jgi:hypothetical protein
VMAAELMDAQVEWASARRTEPTRALRSRSGRGQPGLVRQRHSPGVDSYRQRSGAIRPMASVVFRWLMELTERPDRRW